MHICKNNKNLGKLKTTGEIDFKVNSTPMVSLIKTIIFRRNERMCKKAWWGKKAHLQICFLRYSHTMVTCLVFSESGMLNY